MVDTPFSNNILLLKRIHELTWAELAEIGGVTAQAAHKWGRGGDVQPENLQRLANHFEVEQGDLKYKPLRLSTAQKRTLHKDSIDSDGHPQPGELPLISRVAAGKWSEAFDPYAPGAAQKWVNFGRGFSSSAFALEVEGDSMENPKGKPTFPDKTLIAVEPALRDSIKSGDFVVVRHDDWNEATFKQYIQDAGMAMLRPLNPQWRTLPMPYDAVICGRVMKRKLPDDDEEL